MPRGCFIANIENRHQHHKLDLKDCKWFHYPENKLAKAVLESRNTERFVYFMENRRGIDTIYDKWKQEIIYTIRQEEVSK